MSGLDSFAGLAGGEGMDPGAFERFKEQMSENSAHIAALQKAQAKQQKQENKLIQIILKFIKSSSNTGLVLLVTQLLEQNVPAQFILAIILLGNEDIQAEVGIKLCIPEEDMVRLEATQGAQTSTTGAEITLFGQNASVLPLKVRIAIDLWAQSILDAGLKNPDKVLNSVFMPGTRENKPEIKKVVVRTIAYVLTQYVRSNEMDVEIAQIDEFSYFLIDGILRKVEESLRSPELRAASKDRQYEE